MTNQLQTPEEIAAKIAQVKEIMYSPEVINSPDFLEHKKTLNTLLELQECHNRKRLIGEAENTLQNSKLV
jgi:hypothetical protein